MTDQPMRPPAPSGVSRTEGLRPSDYNPDLANAQMVRDMIARFPTPSIVTEKFTVFHGLMRSLNHSDTNPTYLNVGGLVTLLDKVNENSVNKGGALFNNFWAYAMHPNYIIQGMPSVASSLKEEEPGFLRRIINRLSGKSNEPQQGAKPNG